ncbi:DUF1707 SHOCT-like domain-containing protein [Nocardioides sp. Soil805]|uniref:DUF1707 SHOCT-like domain-containing protein n=1 Tax=Nocardioides sp. Soil805 TaxID=1736416 RepID=UPI000702A016|nr:DUF1707 domain-containing protein [Nocardioides sp. Soil805]KRF36129.1 hypothetical protein ASG94_01180 [Nocardioides sp. Soil805]
MASSSWDRFEHDPRSADAAGLRASDRDRDVALEVLGEAYADGRLAREEYDDRAAAVVSAKTLGELPPQLEDLVPAAGLPVPDRGTLQPASDLHRQAVDRWARDRREAVTGLLTVSLICWTIWAVVMFGGFPWPVFPMVAQAAVLLRTQLQKQDIVERHERRLLRKRTTELGPDTDAGPGDD